MFENIGKKIKGLAKTSFWIGTIIFTILAITLMIILGDDIVLGALGILIGLITLVVGVIISWLGSCFVYGFGELIDKACDIEVNTRISGNKSNEQIKTATDRIIKIENLLSQGLITEEEYQKAIASEK